MSFLNREFSVLNFLFGFFSSRYYIVRSRGTYILLYINLDIPTDGTIRAGGLMYARKTLVADVQVMDEMFKKYHESSKDGLLRCKYVIGGFIDQLKEKFEHLYDVKLLAKFARYVFLQRNNSTFCHAL